jgi:uncharacterized membrane protein YdfJ with MMPL/SSD domain
MSQQTQDRAPGGRASALVTRHPWRVLIAAIAVGVVATVFGGPVVGLLQGGGFTDPHSESSLATDRLTQATGVDADHNIVALVHVDAGVTSAAGRAEVSKVRQGLLADPGVGAVRDTFSQNDSALVSSDGRSTYLVAALKAGTIKSYDNAAARIHDQFAGDPSVLVGGSAMANHQATDQVGKDLARAELIAFPILFLLTLVVFRGVIAALMPLMVGGLTIITTLLGLRVVNSVTDLSQFAVNLVTGLGLGLAIDYSLLIISRYREEAARTGYGAEAMRTTLATSGRAVLFSSFTVAAAMAALLVFPQQFLYSMGVGGVLATLSAAAVALLVLPAVIMVLGPRIDALSPRRFRLRTRAPGDPPGGWYRFSRAVMRRPGTVVLATGALLLLLGAPFLGIKFTSVDASILPQSASARQVSDALHHDFGADVSVPITIVVEAPATASQDVATLSSRIRSLPNVAAATPPQLVGAGTWTITAISSAPVLSDGSTAIVTAIRALPSDHPVLVAGATAQFMDLQSSLRAHLPLAITIVALVTVVVLFVLTGSVLLPIKALLMNGLSLSAAFGLLVLIFQDGRLTGLLGYTSQGALESTQPILLFAIAFGLSTDYGVFLLSRIKEGHDAGLPTTEAVAQGLERTGRIVTAAAVLFTIAIGAFATSSIIFIKELGVGTALAVIIDASIVRALLVPALMKLLGDWNWWAPRPLRALHRRLGLGHLEGTALPA